jgi:aminoglycoside phosphotransferase (APT) family kinase protein
VQALQSDEGAKRIARFIAEQAGESRAEVSGLRRLAGGSSRQVWSLDAVVGDRRLELVLRIDPTFGSDAARVGRAGGFSGEFEILRAAHARGVPVPRPWWWCGDPEPLGGPFYLMDRVEGETIARRIFRSEELESAREKLPAQLGTALASVHTIDVGSEALAWLPAPPPGRSSPEAQLDQLRLTLDAAPSPTPVGEWAYRWLVQNLHDERDRTFVHGDFRVGNVIVGPDGLRSILDWELAHVGDPHEDLAWMCTKTWRFGNVDRPVGGVGPREPFYAAYEAASGRKLDRELLHYWEALCSLKVLGVWIIQMRSYLTGILPSVEQAAIGRRMAETELDLLQLLDDAHPAR